MKISLSLAAITVLTAGVISIVYWTTEAPSPGHDVASPGREISNSPDSAYPAASAASRRETAQKTSQLLNNDFSQGLQADSPSIQNTSTETHPDTIPPQSQTADAPDGVSTITAQASPAASLPTAPLPLVFRSLTPEVAATNPQLAAALQAIQQSFANAVGTNQNPNDPAYYDRWTSALKSADEQYRLLVGDQAYTAEQIKLNSNQ